MTMFGQVKRMKMMINRGGGDDDIAKTNLGNDILCEILSRLPVKSVIRFKRVCKRWQSLIQSPHLAELHLARSKTPSLIIRIRMLSLENPIIRLYDDDDYFLVEDFLKGDTAVHRVTIEQDETVLRSVNGLFCLTKAYGSAPVARIYNPSTGEITPPIIEAVPIEKENGVSICRQYGFGFDPATKEHKVICVSELRREGFGYLGIGRVDVICEVLTVGKDNRWRRINEVPPYRIYGCYEDSGIYANGSIYWRNAKEYDHSGEHEVIVSFDVGTEKFIVIPVPNFIQLDITQSSSRLTTFPHIIRFGGQQASPSLSYTLLEVDGCIALFYSISRYEVKLWIYDDVDKKVSNTRTRNNWTEETISLPFPCDESWIVSLYAIAGTDLIILKSFYTKFYSEQPREHFSLHYYDRKKMTCGELKISGIFSLPTATAVDSIQPFLEGLWPVN